MVLLNEEIERDLQEGNLIHLARKLPHCRDNGGNVIKFLMESNLLSMRDHLNHPLVTLGADPEFILQDKDKNVVLFSSEIANDAFGLSEAQIGADYGLLEFRPKPQEKIGCLVKEISDLHKKFEEKHPDLSIMESEAIDYDHKLARIRESILKKKDINFGINRGKDLSVWSSAGTEITLGQEVGVSLNAYDRPFFNQYNEKLLTAGGHIHIGGRRIMMFSFEQLKLFVRKLDEMVLPICRSVETPAAHKRNSVYGSVGEFRLKPYGIEYRSPSNAIFWKKNLSKLTEILEIISNILNNPIAFCDL